jgi:threonine/homoserine/homoserine lactone efflux protein
MSDIYSLISGFLIGLSLAVPPGPINAMIAAESIKTSAWRGIKLGLGAMTADATYLAITLIGVAVLLKGDDVRMAISLIGGIILLYMGILTLKSYKNPIKESDNSALKNPYVMGLTMGFVNPAALMWWVTAGAALITGFNELSIIGFFSGIIIWVAILAMSMHYAKAKIQGIYPVVIMGCGICILFFGVLLLYNAATIALSL